MEIYTVDNIRDFDLDHIFDCGQCFRWKKETDGSYTGIAMGKVVNMKYEPIGVRAKTDNGLTLGVREKTDKMQCEPEPLEVREKTDNSNTVGRLTIYPCTENEFRNIWSPYLDLGRDYGAIKKTLCENDPVMKKAVDFGYGIRLLKQDLWETIVSFIISQNNNIPRIKGCIERLCRTCGQPTETESGQFGAENGCFEAESGSAGTEGRRCYLMPGPEEMARLTEDGLSEVRLGYRARYLIETAKEVCEKGLPENEEQLLSLCGVGPKVANCVLLFGMGKYDSFPIDVWVRRVMHELYGIDEKDRKAMNAYARENFGDLGGFAQQYLFYYMRSIAE